MKQEKSWAAEFIIMVVELLTPHFLAPLAGRQRSFSNAESSVVVRRLSSTFNLKLTSKNGQKMNFIDTVSHIWTFSLPYKI